jgi:ABC-type transport system involved in multi-copper enzyme maturation permease subunit
MGFLAWTEVRRGLTSVRVIAIASAVGFTTVLLAYALGASATGVPTASFPLWRLGPDGALLALAFGFAPLLLPAIPMGLAYDVGKRDLRSGYPEAVLTRPAPRWTTVLARIGGWVATGCLLIVIVDAACLVALAAATGASPSAGLAAAFVADTLVLAALYLTFGMVLLVVLTPSQFAWLAFPWWAYHQAVRPLALVVAGQFLLILPIRGPVTYATALSDLASFTGIVMGLLAPRVPSDVGFTILPSVVDLTGSVAFAAVPLVALPLIGFFVLLYMGLNARMPLGR